MNRALAFIFFASWVIAIFYFATPGSNETQKGYTQAEAEAIGLLAAMAQTPSEKEATEFKSRVHPVKLYYDKVPEYDTIIQITPAGGECRNTGLVWFKGACWRRNRIKLKYHERPSE